MKFLKFFFKTSKQGKSICSRSCKTADNIIVVHSPDLASGMFHNCTSHADLPVTADDDYILESIRTPNAKTVDGFPPNYMPPYVLKDLEYQSLVLYIQSLAKGE